jgi:DNA (cytosine-5)-methyltransferase 1
LNVFAGAGALALGFEQAGMHVCAAVEPDPVHAATFKRNFPSTHLLCIPVGRSAAEMIADQAGPFDVVAGALPSSAFSVGGRRDPADDRFEVLEQFVDVVLACRPERYALEAVPGLLSRASAGRLSTALARLACAYDSPQHWVLNAANFGLPQTRSRVWVVGGLEGTRPPAPPPPQVVPVHRRPAGLPVFPRDGLPVGPTVWDAIGDLPDPSAFAQLRRSDRMCYDPADRPAPSAWAQQLAADRTLGHARRRLVDPTMLTASQATAHAAQSIWRFASTRPGKIDGVSRFYRLHPDGLARTLRAGTGRDRGSFTAGRPLHPTQPRVITVREGARLQGLPDWFGLHATKWHGFHQVGAGSPPPVARAVAEELLAATGRPPHAPSEPTGACDDSLLFLDLTSAARRVGAVDLPEPRRPGAGVRPRPRPSGRERLEQLALEIR